MLVHVLDMQCVHPELCMFSYVCPKSYLVSLTDNESSSVCEGGDSSNVSSMENFIVVPVKLEKVVKIPLILMIVHLATMNF